MSLSVRLAVLAVALGTACTPAFAVDMPPRKPGLWLMTMTMADGGKPAREMRMCIDSSTEAAMMSIGGNMLKDACSKNEVKRDGFVVTTSAVCDMGSTRMTSQGTTRFDGDTAYHSEIHTKYDPPFMGRAISDMTQDAKWIGPCPADMQPGDVAMPNGMKMNLKTMMSGQPQN
jgi:hypothetical protein